MIERENYSYIFLFTKLFYINPIRLCKLPKIIFATLHSVYINIDNICTRNLYKIIVAACTPLHYCCCCFSPLIILLAIYLNKICIHIELR